MIDTIGQVSLSAAHTWWCILLATCGCITCVCYEIRTRIFRCVWWFQETEGISDAAEASTGAHRVAR